MKKLIAVLLIALMMVQCVSLADEIDVVGADEVVIAESLEQEVQETSAELPTEEELLPGNDAVDQCITEDANGMSEVSNQEEAEEESIINDEADLIDPSNEVLPELPEEAVLSDIPEAENLIAEPQESAPVVITEEALVEEIETEQSDAEEPPAIYIDVEETNASDKILAESSGFTADQIDLLYKKAYATLDKGMVKQIDLGDEYGSKWKSSNKKVATVNKEGVVTCKARGTTKITVTARKKHGKSSNRTLVLKVVDPLDPSELYIYDGVEKEVSKSVQYSYEYSWRVVPGFKHQMEAVVYPEGSNKNITWKTSNKKVVSITKNGYMTCLKPGTARITVKSDNGLSAWMDVIVQKNSYGGISNIDKGLAYCIEDNTARIYLKSLNVVNNNKVEAVFYLCNGTNRKIRKLKNLTFAVNCGYPEYNNGTSYPFLSKRVSRIDVKCKAQRWTTFKVKFTGKEIKDIEWFFNNPDIIVEDACSFTYSS